MARRITKLYKILEHRFQSDVKVWLSHIDFLKRMVSEPLCDPMFDLQPIPQYVYCTISYSDVLLCGWYDMRFFRGGTT